MKGKLVAEKATRWWFDTEWVFAVCASGEMSISSHVVESGCRCFWRDVEVRREAVR